MPSGDLNNALSLGYIKAGSAETASFTWRPDFRLGPLAAGLDVNVPLGAEKPFGYESVVLRFAEYNDGQKGLRYGVFDSVTLGRGLLMNGYSTRISGPLALNNRQTGMLGYVQADRVKLEAFGTWSHVYAVRMTQAVHPMLILGQSYVTDVDGPSVVEPDGTTIQYPSVSGLSFDISVPLPLNLEGYAEAAKLVDHGSAFTYGMTWGMDAMAFMAKLNAGYRAVDKNFVPGYFNADYESNPVNIASYEASGENRDGYITELELLAGGLVSARARYENYNGSSTASFRADASVSLMQADLSAYYKQPSFVDFRSLDLAEGALLGGSIAYRINPFTALVLNYKKAYDAALGQVVESQYYEARFTL